MAKIVIERFIDAPREKVFEAWTNPELAKKWWGPEHFFAPYITLDAREGGKYLFCMEEEGTGQKTWSAGEFKKIDAPNKLVMTDYFSDEHGNKVDPKEYGMDENFPSESMVTITFEEVDSGTKLSLIYNPPSEKQKKAMKDSKMVEGWNSSLDKLERAVNQSSMHA